MKQDFAKPFLIASYSTISEIANEKPMYAMINIKGTIFKLKGKEQKVCKNCKTLKIRKAIFEDGTDCIQITFFDNNVSKVLETTEYQIKNVG